MATVINEPELIRKSKAEFDKYMAIEADEVNSAGVILDTDKDSIFSSDRAPHFGNSDSDKDKDKASDKSQNISEFFN